MLPEPQQKMIPEQAPPQTLEAWVIHHLEESPDFIKGAIAAVALIIFLWIARHKIMALFSRKSSD